MANSFVRLRSDESGKKVQSYENTIGSDVVEAQAVVWIDPAGWTNQYVQARADSTGKKIQTYENTVGGNVVNALAVVLVNTAGTSIYG